MGILLIYLLDANVLINANNFYYSFDAVPQFWEWLIHMGNSDYVKIPLEIYQEIKNGTDDLSQWIKIPDVKSSLLLQEDPNPSYLTFVVNNGYANDLTDIEFQSLGMDPFLISYAYNQNGNRTIVTAEGSKPSCKRQNRHVPDVCSDLGIPFCNQFEFAKALRFSTNWKNT